MMTPNYANRKDPSTSTKPVTLPTAVAGQPYVVGEDPARLEQDKRAIYKLVFVLHPKILYVKTSFNVLLLTVVKGFLWSFWVET